MKSIQLYIDNQLDLGELVELDLYEDEPIKLIDSIQNVTDITKIFDTFTRDFKVPASPNNNRVFKGFADSKIINGFDSRVKISAVIKVNGQDFKKGRVRIINVSRDNNGRASSYKLSFQGGISTIKERLNGRKLKDLNFQKLNIPYSDANLVAGIRDGLYARGTGEAVSQVSVITIESTPNQGGSCRISLNGVLATIFVTSSSPTDNANEIATIVNINANYSAQAVRNLVIIVSNSRTLQQATLFDSFQAIGMLANVVTTQWGGTNNSGELDDNGVKLYPDVIYAPIFTDAKVVAVPYVEGVLTDTYKPTNTQYDFTLNKFTGNGFNNTSDKEGEEADTDFTVTPITPQDYKPSVKVSRLLRMIAADYNLQFSNEFYHMEEIDQLYMFFNGKVKDSGIADKGSAFNKNTSTELAGVDEVRNSVTITTEVNPRGDGIPFNGAANLDQVVPNRSQFGWRQATRNFVFVKQVQTLNGDNITYTINYYFYKDDGDKVILNSDVYEGQETNGRMSSLGIEDRYSRRYFDEEIAGRQLFYEVIAESTKGVLLGNIDIELELFNLTSYNSSVFYFDITSSDETPVVTTRFLNIKRLVPDMKCIDLLTGIFKMFNLTAYIDENDNIVVKKLIEFYDEGNTIDITSSVITDSDESLSLGFKYKSVDMKFQEAEDVLTKNYAPLGSSTRFGDINIDKNSFLGEEETSAGESVGTSFAIDLPFQSMMFEQLALSFREDLGHTNGVFSTSEDGLATDMVIGNCIDAELSRVDTKPILFYGKQVRTDVTYSSTSSTSNKITNLAGRLYTSPVAYTESGNTAGRIGSRAGGRGYIVLRDAKVVSNNIYGLAKFAAYRDGGSIIGDDDPEKWWNPSGMMASRFRRDGVTPINYNNYFTACRFNNDNYDENEFINNYPSQRFISGLYQSNYEDYLKNIFKKNARLNKFKVRFNKRLLNTYKLNDTFIVDAKAYTINKIEIDILTGEGTLELLNKLDLPTGTPIYNPNA